MGLPNLLPPVQPRDRWRTTMEERIPLPSDSAPENGAYAPLLAGAEGLGTGGGNLSDSGLDSSFPWQAPERLGSGNSHLEGAAYPIMVDPDPGCTPPSSSRGPETQTEVNLEVSKRGRLETGKVVGSKVKGDSSRAPRVPAAPHPSGGSIPVFRHRRATEQRTGAAQQVPAPHPEA